ncbi:unnamed protein product, partial [Rotaria sp. Silwood2]
GNVFHIMDATRRWWFGGWV